jgi:hypothetical protein
MSLRAKLEILEGDIDMTFLTELRRPQIADPDPTR